MSEWGEQIDQIARITSKENVTNITGVPSWTLVLLKHILEITGKKNIIEVWPNLELFIHGGVSFVPYRTQFARIIGKPINYLETYNASEGFFGIQDRTDADDMLLMLDYGIFYEFVNDNVGYTKLKIYIHKQYNFVIDVKELNFAPDYKKISEFQ